MSPAAPHDRKAEFEEVALPYLDPLFNLALSLTRNRKDAEDLVQETYLRAYRFFDTYRAGTHVKAWLFRILRNTFINRYRAARARPDEVALDRLERAWERVVERPWPGGRTPTPEEALMNGVPAGEVQRAMAELPEEYRTVVLMALVEEMAYKEIASALSIPIGTVMSRLHRGRRLLQGALAEYARRQGIIRGDSAVDPDDAPDA